jgi:hypothetical protein
MHGNREIIRLVEAQQIYSALYESYVARGNQLNT